ncbi:MAG: polyprenol monophosphomannose synthase [Candidatus Altiarchaeota archaeon]
MTRVLVMLPTYNEAENIGSIIGDILEQGEDVDVLVVDDSSPDGTWRIVEGISSENSRVNLLKREGKRGRGLAGVEGYKYGIENKYDAILEMDADYSHDPEHIPELLKALEDADVVLGSRLVEGGMETGRPWMRRIITKLANTYIRLMLGLDVRDCNSGFRCFKREVLEAIKPETITSEGPGIVQEALFKAHLKGFRIREVPIRFKDRVAGESKLGVGALISGYTLILKLKFHSMLGGD